MVHLESPEGSNQNGGVMMINKIIPANATLYCFHCMCEEPVREGELKKGILPIFCKKCGKQISELISTREGWRLHQCFYKKEV